MIHTNLVQFYHSDELDIKLTMWSPTMKTSERLTPGHTIYNSLVLVLGWFSRVPRVTDRLVALHVTSHPQEWVPGSRHEYSTETLSTLVQLVDMDGVNVLIPFRSLFYFASSPVWVRFHSCMGLAGHLPYDKAGRRDAQIHGASWWLRIAREI